MHTTLLAIHLHLSALSTSHQPRSRHASRRPWRRLAPGFTADSAAAKSTASWTSFLIAFSMHIDIAHQIPSYILPSPTVYMHQTLMEMPPHDCVSAAPSSSQFILMTDSHIDPSDVIRVRPIYMYCVIAIVGSRCMARGMGLDDRE